MLNYLKRNRWCVLGVCALQIVVWGLQTVAQLLLMKTFEGAMALDFSVFLFWTLMSLLCWAAYLGCGVFLGYVQAQTVRKLNNTVRNDMLQGILYQKYQAYHMVDTGEHLSQLTSEVEQIEKLAWNPFFNCVGRCAQIIWSIIALWLIDWRLFAASVFTAVFMWLLPKMFEKKMQTLGENNREAKAMATARLKEILHARDILKLYGKENSFMDRGRTIGNNMEVTQCRLSLWQELSAGVLGIVNVGLQILGDVLIVVLAISGRIPIAVLAGGSNLIAGVTNGFTNVSGCRISLITSRPYFEKIQQEKQLPENTILEGEKLEGIPEIRLDKIGFSYDQEEVLSNISMVFEPNKKYAIIGPSGSGKSTIMRILLGWLDGYSGKIYINHNLAGEDYALQIRDYVSYVEQEVFLFCDTIRNNICMGDNFSESEIQEAVKNSALDKDLSNFPLGLDTVIGENGASLSGGQRQRIAIARALIRKRSIFLIDEGTSGLDRERAAVVETNLLYNPNITLIMISHHLTEERKKKFDKIYELD
ncbi:MAG: ABC transporter ATP-binding protein [Oscillospiraceae bacterium]|nr:ABC transporter ATP-binding protein [Oscillospiraceae bacterium]